MAGKSSTAVEQKVGSDSPCMRKFTSSERKTLFRKALLVHRQDELDIRLLKKTQEASPQGRILVVTPKKVGNAPQRNLLRRRLKALFHEEGWDAKSIDMLVYCRKGAAALSYQALKQIVHTAYESLNKPTSFSTPSQ